MRAIILAAGKGSRLNGTVRLRSSSYGETSPEPWRGRAAESPKCLVELGGVSLIERQIRVLRDAGIDDIAVVVGCQAERVRRVCGHEITYVENTRYAQTNSLYSLWMARPLLYEAFVVLNCDVVFHPALLTDLLSSRHENALLLGYREASQPPYGDEEMKVKVQGGRVVDMSKEMDPAEADGENLGIVKFGARGAAALVEIMDELVAEGRLRDWAPRAFAVFARRYPLFAIGTRGLPWIEIDFPEDYQRALHEILPAIEDDGRAATSPVRVAAPSVS